MNRAMVQVAVAQPSPPPNIIPLKVEMTSIPSPWILNPAIDLMFCCGGLLWLFFLFHNVVPLLPGDQIGLLLLVSVAGTHILSETHTAATLVRLHSSVDTQKHLRSYVKYVSIICALIAIVGLATPALTPILAKIYFVWIVQHFMAQSYGITLIYCYKRNYSLSNIERKILKFLFDATIVYAIARQFTYPEWGSDNFLGKPLPYFQLLPGWFCAGLAGIVQFAALAFVCMVIAKFIRERKMLPLPAALLMVTGISIFLIPKSIASSLWLYVPAFYHGCQYLVVATSFRLKEQGLPENVSAHQLSHMLLRSSNLQYWGQLFMIAIFIYIGVPRLLNQVGVDFVTAFATIFCVINFHHFLVDAAIWKLRDSKVRKLLVA
jgi:hypothetical protein